MLVLYSDWIQGRRLLRALQHLIVPRGFQRPRSEGQLSRVRNPRFIVRQADEEACKRSSHYDGRETDPVQHVYQLKKRRPPSAYINTQHKGASSSNNDEGSA